MWIFIRQGFFSVVEDSQDPNRLVVRARVAADLNALRADVPDLSRTTATPSRDYPYRAFCPREAFAGGIAKIAMEIDYRNFKSEVMRIHGPPREHLYEEVWAIMRQAETRLVGQHLAPRRPCALPAPQPASTKRSPPRRARR